MYDNIDINITKLKSLEELYNTLAVNKVFFAHVGDGNAIFNQLQEEIASGRQQPSAAVCYGELLVLKTDATCMFIYFERLDGEPQYNTSQIFFKMYSILGNHNFDTKWKRITTTDV